MAIILPAAQRAAGTYVLPSTSVPVGSTGARVLFDRSALVTAAGSLAWALELSVDGGTSWASLGGSGLNLAGLADPAYTEPLLGIPASGMQRGFLICDGPNGTRVGVRAPLPGETVRAGYETTNAARRIRGTLTLTTTVTIGATVDWLTD